MNKAQGFDRRVEGLRGIAAAAVAITHASATFRIDDALTYWTVPLVQQSNQVKVLTMITAVFNASGAVVLFFVLSGYVLALSFRKSNIPMSISVPAYFARRALRLLPAMWVSIAIYTLIINLIRPGSFNPYGAWFTANFQHAPTLGDALANAALIDFKANSATWTMYVEFIGSLALPFFCICCRAYSLRTCIAIGVALTIVADILYSTMAIRYLFCFFSGCLMAYHPPLFRAPRTSARALWIGLALSIACRLMPVGHEIVELMIEALASVLLLGAILNLPRNHALFTNPVIDLFGKVSYSFYLLHGILIYIFGIIFARLLKIDIGVFFITVLAVISFSFAFALISYRFVEAPPIRLGRRLFRSCYLNASDGAVKIADRDGLTSTAADKVS